MRYCIRQGHTPLSIHNGFCGLLDDNVNDLLSWLGVNSWMAQGRSELGQSLALIKAHHVFLTTAHDDSRL
jgi:hypothetical protein